MLCSNDSRKTPAVYGFEYFHLYNKREGWNKHGRLVKSCKSMNIETGINVDGGLLWGKYILCGGGSISDKNISI